MTRLIGAVAGFAIAALLALPAQAETTARAYGLRNAEPTEFSARKRWKRHRHWRGHRHYRGPRVYFGAPFFWAPPYWGPRYRYWGPRYRYRSFYPYYGYYRPFYRPAISVSFGFGPRYGWWW